MANKTKKKKIMPLIRSRKSMVKINARPSAASTSMLAASAALRKEMAKVKKAKTPAAKAKKTADVKRMSSAIKRVALALPQRTLAPATRKAVEKATKAASTLQRPTLAPRTRTLRPVSQARGRVPAAPAFQRPDAQPRQLQTGGTEFGGDGLAPIKSTPLPAAAGFAPLPHSALIRSGLTTGIPAAGRLPLIPGLVSRNISAQAGDDDNNVDDDNTPDDDGFYNDDYDDAPDDTDYDGGGGGGGGGGGYYSDDYGAEDDGFWADDDGAPYAADDIEYEDEYGEIVEYEDGEGEEIDDTAAADASAAVDEEGGLLEMAKAHPIISALVLAGLGYGGYRGYQYWQARRAQG